MGWIVWSGTLGLVLIFTVQPRIPCYYSTINTSLFSLCRGFDIGNHFCEWMYDYNCDEFPFFKVNAQAYPSKAQQVWMTFSKWALPPGRSRRFSCLVNESYVSVQLHFIESYLRESERGFDLLSEEEQEKLKREVYVEVNRWDADMTRLVWAPLLLYIRYFNCFSQFASPVYISFFFYYFLGFLWRRTSFGAYGPSSRPDSPPSSLDTWWVKYLI